MCILSSLCVGALSKVWPYRASAMSWSSQEGREGARRLLRMWAGRGRAAGDRERVLTPAPWESPRVPEAPSICTISSISLPTSPCHDCHLSMGTVFPQEIHVTAPLEIRRHLKHCIIQTSISPSLRNAKSSLMKCQIPNCSLSGQSSFYY